MHNLALIFFYSIILCLYVCAIDEFTKDQLIELHNYERIGLGSNMRKLSWSTGLYSSVSSKVSSCSTVAGALEINYLLTNISYDNSSILSYFKSDSDKYHINNNTCDPGFTDGCKSWLRIIWAESYNIACDINEDCPLYDPISGIDYPAHFIMCAYSPKINWPTETPYNNSGEVECEGCVLDTNWNGLCDVGLCTEPTCDDGIKDGDEEGIDCGGSCPTLCYHWYTSSYGDCSVTCGDGIKSRTVECRDSDDNPADTSHCTEPEPDNTIPCAMPDCYYWNVSAYGNCTGLCGTGNKIREVFCLNISLEICTDSYCLLVSSKPESKTNCLLLLLPCLESSTNTLEIILGITIPILVLVIIGIVWKYKGQNLNFSFSRKHIQYSIDVEEKAIKDYTCEKCRSSFYTLIEFNKHCSTAHPSFHIDELKKETPPDSFSKEQLNSTLQTKDDSSVELQDVVIKPPPKRDDKQIELKRDNNISKPVHPNRPPPLKLDSLNSNITEKSELSTKIAPSSPKKPPPSSPRSEKPISPRKPPPKKLPPSSPRGEKPLSQSPRIEKSPPSSPRVEKPISLRNPPPSSPRSLSPRKMIGVPIDRIPVATSLTSNPKFDRQSSPRVNDTTSGRPPLSEIHSTISNTKTSPRKERPPSPRVLNSPKRDHSQVNLKEVKTTDRKVNIPTNVDFFK